MKPIYTAPAGIFLSLFILFAEASAATIVVCADCNYCMPSEAIAVAEAGDTILIKSGTYYETNIDIDKALTVIGENYPVIDGQMMDHIITITADSVSVEGLQVQNVGVSFVEDRAAIRMNQVSHFKILNNKVFNTFFAIYAANSSYGIIRGNEVHGQAVEEMTSGNAIHAWYCTHLDIEDNQVFGHRDGIYLEFVHKSRIFKNHSHNNLRYGLHFMFSNDDQYYDNTFRNNGAGVAVMFSKRILMHDNLFINNWGRSSYGLLLKEINDAEIFHNVFNTNTLGIFIEGSNRITYRENDFLSNGWAIKMHGGCTDNHFTQNNFLSNTFDMAAEARGVDNSYDENHWSEYTGYDLDKDGLGDVPFRPVKLFSYLVNRTPESIVLLRSPFVGLLNFSEKASPIFTPTDLMDHSPLMKPVRWDEQIQQAHD